MNQLRLLNTSVRDFLIALSLIGMAVSAHAQTFLIDIGSDESFRGLSITSPDANGNHWTSVWSGAFYEDIVDTTGAVSTVDFGFDASLVTGTDSYNGPAGPTDANFLYDSLLLQEIDEEALGNLGGAPEAAFDFYVSSRFQIQQLDPTKIYDLTFYGSHKYNDAGPVPDNNTRYTVYSDETFTTPVATVDLEVGVDGDHNQDMVAVLSGLSPSGEFGDILYVEFVGAAGGYGYLNALQVETFTPSVAPGDFNGDTLVNAMDYALWRDNLGGNEDLLGGAGDGSGVVDTGDFTLWSDNYGNGTAPAPIAATPEPTALLLILSGVTGVVFNERRRRFAG